jgi:YesN/AraC family two-component response regulator
MARVVLLVDDDALGGRHAIDTLVADDRIKILITDVNMPDMDGFAVAAGATRDRGAGSVPLPVGSDH